MAYINNTGYENKREWAARRMAENKEIETLTNEQHELLEELCSFRHELHTNWDSAFNPQSGSFNRFANEISSFSVGLTGHDLHTRICEAFGTAPFNPIDYPTLDDYEDYDYDNVDEAYDDACSLFSRINNEIELFLTNIDKEHDTSYAPTGATRIY